MTPVDEIVILANGVGQRPVLEILEELGSFPPTTSLTVLESHETLLTSQACNLLLEATRSDYATLLADDDLLERNFSEVLRMAIRAHGDPVVVSFPIRVFDSASGPDLAVAGGGRSRRHLSSKTFSRVLAGCVGLLPGGGSVFPVLVAKQARVFEAPQGVRLEDQLMSSRLLRTGIAVKLLEGSSYLQRFHPGQTSRRVDELAPDLAVVRKVRVIEERRFAIKLLNVLAVAHDMRNLSWIGRRRYLGALVIRGGVPLAR